MPKPQLEDVEISSQPEVKVGDSERFSALSWWSHHAGQIAKGGAALVGLAVLGGLGYFARGVFSGTRKTETVTLDATDERSIVVKESAGAVAKSGDLAGFSDEAKTSVPHDAADNVGNIQIADGKIDFGDAKVAATHEDTTEIEEIVTPGVKRSLVQNSGSGASSQPLVGTTVVQNLVVNGTIPDQLINVGYPLSGAINITELFGERVSLTGFSQVGNKPFPDWLQASPELIAPGVSGFDARGVTVSGNFAYVAYNNGTNGGLKIIDISNSTNPFLVGPGVSGFSANGVTVSGNFAYVAVGGGWGWYGLKIIDISNSTNPFPAGPGVLGFNAYGVTVIGNLAYVAAYEGLQIIDISNSTNPFPVGHGVPVFKAYGVTVNGNFAYIAAEKGFQIIDISNSTNPVLRGSISGFGANTVTVSGNFAYIAADDQGLQIIDISDSTNPVRIGGLSGFIAQGVTVRGNLAYVAWKNSLDSNGGLSIFDISNGTNPERIEPGLSGFIAGGVTVSGNLAYVASSNQGLQIIDLLQWQLFGSPVQSKCVYQFIISAENLHGNSTKIFNIRTDNFPYVIGSIPTQSLNPGSALSLYVKMTSIFNDQDEADTLSLTINPRLAWLKFEINPFFIAKKTWFYGGYSGGATDVTVSGNFAYVTVLSGQGLRIIDISDSTNPVLTGGLSGLMAQGVVISGNLAYVTGVMYQGLQIIDISDSTNPVRTGGLSGFNAFGVTVSGNFAYVASSDQGLQIIDISDSTNPVLIGVLSGFNAQRVTVSSNLAYVATPGQGLKIIDVSQPSKPIIVGEASGMALLSVALRANEVYAVGDCFSILDVTNYQFSGTPTASDAGNYQITVIATDPMRGQVNTSFTIRVEGGPRLGPNVTIPPRIALVGQSANFFLDQGTFNDPNYDVITYTASLANGGKLPPFLSFNPSSATFSGIPTSWDKVPPNYMVTIFASDRIVYPATSANFTLVVQDPIADQTFIVGRNTSSLLPIPSDSTFEGRSLVYSIKPRNIASMPSWLYFDAPNRKLFGAPSVADNGTIPMQVTLNDGYGEAFFLFTLNAKLDTPPVLASMIPVQSAKAEKLFQFVLEKDTFTDADGDQLSYSASLGDAASWLKFDADSQTFSGTPSGWTDTYPYVTRKYTITVKATDPSNKSATGTFELDLNGPSSWEILISTTVSVLGALVAVYGYTQKKYLLWDFFKKKQYIKPLESLVIGDTTFSHKISFPADHIKSIIVTTSHDRSCTQKMSPCLKKTLGFFPTATTDSEERVFSCSGVSAYFFPWLFYDSKANTLKSVEGGPTEEFIGKDIKIQVRGTDNRIMEEFHIKVGGQQSVLSEVADETTKAASSSTTKHKKDTAELEKPLLSPVAGNS